MKLLKKPVITLGMILCLITSQLFSVMTSEAGQQTKITLNHSRLLLQKGKKATLKVKKGLPKGASKSSVTFQSSNKKVASVDKNGKISAKKAGNAKITVKIKSIKLSAVCQIKVVDKLKQVSLTITEMTIKQGEKINLPDYVTSEQ